MIKQESKYKVTPITTFQHFAKLSDQWNALLNNHLPQSFFLSHDWFSLWLHHFGNEINPLILLIHEHNRLVAIAPFIVTTSQVYLTKLRTIQLMGNAYSPVKTFVFDNVPENKRQAILSAILSFLFATFRRWDVLQLQPLVDSDVAVHSIMSLLNTNHYKHRIRQLPPSWSLTGINCTGEQYFMNLPKKITHELQRRRRNLEKLGKLSFEIVTGLEQIDQHVDKYYDVYARSWKQKENIGPTFHRDLAKLAAQKGYLRLAFLCLDSFPIATQFRIVSNEACFFLKTAYDTKYRKYSPGLILLAHTIEYFLDIDNVRMIDFGPGNEPYKKNWASQQIACKDVLIFNSNAKGRLIEFVLSGFLPLLKRNKKLILIKDMLYNKYFSAIS